MRYRDLPATVLLLALAGPVCWGDDAATCQPADSPEIVAQAAELREQGRRGLEAALAEYDRLVDLRDHTLMDVEERARIDSQIAHWQRVVELVAQQRSAHVSRLYWHTDLEQALAESREADKPVLSLRIQLRQQPLLSHDPLCQRGDPSETRRAIRPPLAERAAGARGHDRLWRWTQARADPHGKQRPLCAGQRQTAARLFARPLQPGGVQCLA